MARPAGMRWGGIPGHRRLFSPLGWTVGVAGDEAAAEAPKTPGQAALKPPEESDIAKRAAGAAVQTDGVERRIVVLES